MHTLRREATGTPIRPVPERARPAHRSRNLSTVLEWLLQKQTQIINHYGLDLTNPDAQNFLFDNIRGFLFGDVPATAEIDTTKEGSVKW